MSERTRRGPIGRLFSASDLESVREATRQAEAGTSGEVVSYAVERCHGYDGALWLAATLGALGSAVLASLLHDYRQVWGGSPLLWIAAPPLIGAGVGYLLARLVPTVHRAFIPDSALDRLTRLRAEAAFLEEEVFKTRARTGLLIFLALFEHRVVILADEGINQVVDDAEWVAIAERLATGIRQGQAAAALVEAIDSCGRLLAERGVDRPPDDDNELRDELRLRDE